MKYIYVVSHFRAMKTRGLKVDYKLLHEGIQDDGGIGPLYQVERIVTSKVCRQINLAVPNDTG